MVLRCPYDREGAPCAGDAAGPSLRFVGQSVATIAGWAVALALSIASSGCHGRSGGGEPPPPDGGTVQDAGVDLVPWLGAGEPPLVPSGGASCPAGWQEVVGGRGVRACAAYGASGRVDCAAVDEVHLPGTAGCVRLGTSCSGPGQWAADLPTDRPIVFVRAGATGGDGSRASPYGVVQTAVLSAPAGAVIALSSGRYDEIVQLFDGMTLWGACVAETVLRLSLGAPTTSEPVLRAFYGDRIQARNLTIADTMGIGVYAADGATIALRDVALNQLAGFSVYAEGEGSAVELDGVRIHGTASIPGVATGIGLQIFDGARADVRRTSFDDQAWAGIFAADATSSLEITDSVFARAGGSESEDAGYGAYLQDGIRTTIERVAFHGNQRGSLLLTRAATASLRDLHSSDSGAADLSSDAGGPGLSLHTDTVTAAERIFIETARQTAIYANGARLDAADIILRDTRASRWQSTGDAAGLVAGSGAEVMLRRAAISGMGLGAIVLQPDGATVHLEDIVIAETAGSGPKGLGLGLVALGGSLSVERGIVDRSHGAAVAAIAPSATVDLSDVLVRGTDSTFERGSFGRGILATSGGRIEGRRLVVERAREAAVIAFDDGSEVLLSEVIVRQTLAQACGVDSCMASPGGFGVVSLEGASVSLDRFLIADSAIAGAQLAAGGVLRLQHGAITGAIIGVNVQDAAPDYETLLQDVTFSEVDRPIDASALPLPSVGDWN